MFQSLTGMQQRTPLICPWGVTERQGFCHSIKQALAYALKVSNNDRKTLKKNPHRWLKQGASQPQVCWRQLCSYPFLTPRRDMLNAWVNIRTPPQSPATDHISHQGPTPPLQPHSSQPWGRAWLVLLKAGAWADAAAGWEPLMKEHEAGATEVRENLATEREDLLSPRWHPFLQRQPETSWWGAEGIKLLVPLHPSRRGRAGERENFPLQGAFRLLTRQASKWFNYISKNNELNVYKVPF